MEQYLHEAVFILSDINLQGMSGLELLEKIKDKIKEPPLVFMMITAYGNADNYKQAMDLGADDFLSKPVVFSLLKNKINILN